MDPYSSPYIIPNNSYHNAFPHSLLRTRRITGSPVLVSRGTEVHPACPEVENMPLAQICAMLKTDAERGLTEDALNFRSQLNP